MKKIALILALAFLGYGLFTLGSIRGTANFQAKLDSLNKVNDSLVTENEEDSYKIATLQVQDSILTYNITHQKTKVVKVIEYVQVQQDNVDNFSGTETIDFFYKRYPKDTISDPLVLAQPVLKSAAKDLVELDGARQILPIKDSIIATQESRITLKDSTIGLYINKEGRYKSIISNKDLAIAEWTSQYNQLQIQNKKLQLKSKFQRIGFYVIVGGLTYMTLHK